MNLIDNEVNGQRERNTKAIKIIGVTLIILVMIVIALLSYLSYVKSKQFKFELDGTKQEFSSDLFYIDEDGEMYISLKDICKILQNNSISAEYNNGEYKKYNESTSECNIRQTYEIAGYKLDSTKMYKVLVEDNSYEYFTLDKPVKKINNKLYTTKKGIEIGFNTLIIYNENTLSIYTLDALVASYAKQLNNNVINSEDMSFSNKKALKYDMIITKNSNNEYGVQRISTKEMVLGNKYSNLKFMESTKDFIVTTPEKTQGIISTTGGKDIDAQLQFTEIKLLSDDLNLYMVKNNKGKYGVYNREKQKNIIYPEYESIGVDIDQFKNEFIENQYILYENCIPCKKSVDGVFKWEILNTNGNRIIDQEFDSLGYIKGTTKTAKGDNLLLIPEVEGIIVNKDAKYGLISSTGKILVPISTQQIYAEVSAGESTYYMVYNNQVTNLLEALKKANVTVKNKNDNNTTTKNTTTNTTTNTVVENTTTNNTSTQNATNVVTNNTNTNNTTTQNKTNSVSNNTN